MYMTVQVCQSPSISTTILSQIYAISLTETYSLMLKKFLNQPK